MPKQLIAINEIHRLKKAGTAANKEKGTAAIPPVTEKIKPGTIFSAKNDKEYKDLLAGQYPAARKYVAPEADEDAAEEAAEAAAAKKKAAAKTPKKTDKKVEGEGGDKPPVL
jgi:hypothetical protein